MLFTNLFADGNRTVRGQELDASTPEAAADATSLFQTAAELYNERRYAVKPVQ